MKKAKTLSKLIIFIGIIIILGTAGASDLERLTLLESISQILLGSIFIFCGTAGLGLLKILKPAKSKREKIQSRINCRRLKGAA